MAKSLLMFVIDRCSTQILGETPGALSRFDAESWAVIPVLTRGPPPFSDSFTNSDN